MLKNKYEFSEELKIRYLEVERNELNKMYSNKNWEDKYILFLQFELYHPFYFDEMKAELKVHLSEEIKEFPFKIRTPYPNKNIYQISMKNGRRFCNLGIPLFFDTFEGLSEVKQIEANWLLKDKSEEHECATVIKILYDVNFIKHQDKKVYCIHSKDMVYETMKAYENKNVVEKYINEFKEVIHITLIDDGFSIATLIGDEKREIKAKEVLDLVGWSVMSKVFNNDLNDTVSFIKCYSNERLKPNFIGNDLDIYNI